ncbi:MAG: YidC/Oxa1 family insertase periplasmic-domain containing protein, partial [Planctomycetota bacterium]
PGQADATADNDISPPAPVDAGGVIAADRDPPAESAATFDPASLRARVWDTPADAVTLGSLDPDSPYRAFVEFTPRGAGIASLRLSSYSRTIKNEEHVELQRLRSIDRSGDGVDDLTAVPFAVLSVEVDGAAINTAGEGVWRSVEGVEGEADASFQAVIETAAGEDVLRVTRRFVFEPDSFDLSIEQRVENLSGSPITVRLIETGPIDMPLPATRYGGDKRRVRFGYLLAEQLQGNAQEVTADSDLRGRGSIMGDRDKDAQGFKRYAESKDIWPNAAAISKGHRLSWFAVTDRYFGVAVHPMIDPDVVIAGAGNKAFTEVERVERLVLNPYAELLDSTIVTRLIGAPFTLSPGSTSQQDIGVYAGPLLENVLGNEPVASSLNLEGLIVYNFGGPCGEMCTFGWLTHVLLFVLRGFHAVVSDWAVAIVLLVFVVRASLHPITRWSQTRMLRFGAEMQAVGPKMQKLKEKYKDDPKRQQQEIARLYQEEGVNPAGALGCLPMLLQSPVWIAMYATLYFAAEMRHEPAFYGLFQSITGGNWNFLADLASPDQAIPLPESMHFSIPGLSNIWGRIESVNLLPLALGVVFYLHQKYLTPPTASTMSPEQEQMQKTMKIMSVVMFPLFMYPAPSGLAVYFITNSTLGIIESRWIRKQAEARGDTDPEQLKARKAEKRTARSAGGKESFMQRMQRLAAEQQQAREQAAGGGGKSMPRRQVRNTAPGTGGSSGRGYKKRK